MSGVALYAELTPDVASAARAAAERIRAHMGFVAGALIEIGRDLADTKQRLGHGQFLIWIESEFEMSERTAQNLMNVAREFGEKSAKFADLPKSVLYALAAPSTPESVRQEVERRVDAGERVSLDEVMALKRDLVDAKDAVKSAKQDVKVQKSEVQRAKDERDRVRNELDFANARLRQQADEIERLKQDNTIHVYPADEPKTITEVVAAPKPAARASCLRTVAELIAERFDHDIGEVADLLREGGQYSLAMELEQVAGREARGAA